MKCIYCGEEVKEGSLFCAHCGKAVQIVPDYNEYEEDYLKQVLAEENGGDTNKSKKQTQAQAQTAEHSRQQKKKQRNVAIGAAAVVCLLVFALLILGAAIRSNHNNSFSYQVEQAEKAQKKGDIDKAISCYEKALTIDQNSVDVRLALASLYQEKGETDAALVLYQEVIRLDKKNREAVQNLIAIYEKQDNTDAILSLRSAVDDSLGDLFSDYEVTAPEFSLEEGTFDAVQLLTLSSADHYEIYYTLDGGDPAVRGILYTEPIELAENEKTYTVKAACVNGKKVYSDVITKSFRIELAAPDMPIVTPDGGDFGVETTITVTVPDGCTAYYTWSGATPSQSSNRYSRPIMIPEGNNVLSVVLVDNSTGLVSEVFRGNYVYYADDYTQEDVEVE